MIGDSLNICICGGGSLGIVCAGVFLSQGIKVNILTGHPSKWSEDIKVLDPSNKEYTGRLSAISSNPKETVSNADIILLCVPGYLIEKTLLDIKPWIHKRAIVGSIVSSTGFFFIAHKVLDEHTPLFGFQRVPFISRQIEYGHIGGLLGYKDSLNVAIERYNDPNNLRNVLSKIFLTKVNLLNNFYEASLTNSNPILHTGRLYSMWKDYNGEIYKKQTLFYSEWTEEASQYLIDMDNEFMKLLDSLSIRKGIIPSLLDYYESVDARTLTKKIQSITAFKGILSPMIKVENGWIPDFKSRYFTEDFPFGLKYIHNLACQNGIEIPTIKRVYDWGMHCIVTIQRTRRGSRHLEKGEDCVVG